MKTKIKQILISFISMLIINFAFSFSNFWDFGISSPHLGLLYVLGLIFGPYGALGAVFANTIIDLMNGYSISIIIPSEIFTFGISYLAYKLWYSGFKTNKITKPILDNIYHITLFLSSIFICGFIYSAFHAGLLGIYYGEHIDDIYFFVFLLNFTTLAFIFGIIGIWLCEKINFIKTPKTSKRNANKKLYRTLFYFLIILTIISLFSMLLNIDRNIIIGELVLIGILLFSYLTKPFKYKIESDNENTIIEKIIRNFLIITLTIAILGIIITILTQGLLMNINKIFKYFVFMPGLIITDTILMIFFIPSIIILKYIENKVIEPISKFSEIKPFIKKNEKIRSEELINVYSKYINEDNEIGTLAQSYTDLIEHNNNYIENIHEIEGEKKRAEAELDIATKIQASALPTEAIETNEFIVDGYSKPAKKVGGDFFDYYMIDEDNLAIVIGDASGKGVPAALLAMTTKVMIKQILKHEKNPSEVLYSLNNQLSENNSESMFLTLWLGIYNKTTKKLIFSNAGHNPPLIKENGRFKYLKIDSGIVLGIIQDFDYLNDEIILTNELVLYTDGITDANNTKNKMYGEDRLLNFFNEFKNDGNPIVPLLNDINRFTKDAEQFDDMTLLYLKIK